MNKELKTAFETLETQRKNILATLESLSSQKLNSHREGKWSINQVVAHLITSERMTLQYVTKKYNAVATVRNAGPWEDGKMLVLRISQRLPFLKFTAPKIVVAQTEAINDIEILRKQWDQVRSDWATFLETVPDEYKNRMVYKHVVAGRMGLKHAILFMREHIIHHRPQIQRLLR